jgi:yecA family protein
MPTLDSSRLSADELIEIERLLDQVNRDSAMTLEEVDGYLTGLVMAGTLELDMVHWQDVFDLPEPTLKKRLVAQQQDRITRLAERQMAQITARLTQGDLSPLLQNDDAGEQAVPGRDWAAGFVRAMDTEASAFEVMDEDDEVWDWVDPVYDLLEDEPVSASDIERGIDDMIEGLVQLHQWLLVRRG